MRTITKSFIALSALIGLATPVQAANWQIDGSHTVATFEVTHMMISKVRGEFPKVSGTVEFDLADPTKGKADVTIDMATINTREPKRDEHLRSADFFDVAQYPTMRFVSKKITKAGKGLKMTGDLTIRGKTKEVTFDVAPFNGPVANPWTKQESIGTRATTTINRHDFGVSWNSAMDKGGVVVGDEVAITLDIELVKQ